MLFSSLVLLVVGVRKCYFRYSLDWAETDSQSSQGSRNHANRHGNQVITAGANEEQQLVV